MKPGDEAVVLICEPLRMSVRPRTALREFRKISELASFRFVSDPGELVGAASQIASAIPTFQYPCGRSEEVVNLRAAGYPKTCAHSRKVRGQSH
jgi:hypothetical protein